MGAVSVTGYFPCARADFGDGSHRLWSEKNITNIFNALFDINPNTPVVSYDGKYLLLHGYIFEGTFTEGSSYYISITDDELDCPSGTDNVLWDSPSGTMIGGTAQKVKFIQ